MSKIAVTPVLIGINVAVFGVMLAGGIHPMTPAIDSLIQWGANYGPKTTNGEWWRMFTAMFLHIGILHLLFNMLALWHIGGFMERLLGSPGFLALYLLSGLLGSIASVAWNPFVVSAGASGAIFGIYGGLLSYLVRHRDLRSEVFLVTLRNHVLAFLGYNLLFGFIQEGIDMAAHLGGLVGGCACGFGLAQPLSQPRSAWWHVRNTLVGVTGLLLIGSMTTFLPRVGDVKTTLQYFASFDTTTMATFDHAVTQFQRRQITSAELVRTLEQDVLPPWRAQLDTLLRLQSQPRLPLRQQQFVSALVEYMAARREGWELLQEGLRTHDPRLVKSANEKQRQAEQVFEQLGTSEKK